MLSATKIAQYRLHVVEILGQLDQPERPPRHLALTEAQYRQLYRQRRITDCDLAEAFRHHLDLQAQQVVCSLGQRTIIREDIYRIALLFDGFSMMGNAPLLWQRDEMLAFTKIQADVPDDVRRQLLANDDERAVIQALWVRLLDILALPPLSLLEGAALPQNGLAGNSVHESLRQQAGAEFGRLLAHLGEGVSLRDLIQSLSGVDIFNSVRQQLQRICVALAEAGNASWTTDEHQQLDLYGLWRKLARQDASLFLHQLPDWQDIIASSPDDALAAIALQLQCLDIPPAQWRAYLHQLDVELSGWNLPLPLSARSRTGILAIRLTLDRLWLNQVCHDLWKIEAKASALQSYFSKNLSEFWVRLQLYQGLLPEYLSQQANALIVRSGSERQCRPEWQQLADLLVIRQDNLHNRPGSHHNAWRLFRLCQHLGLNANHLQFLDKTDLAALLSVLSGFDPMERGKIWCSADRHHCLQALSANPPKQLQTSGTISPSLQIIHIEALRGMVSPQDWVWATDALAFPDSGRAAVTHFVRFNLYGSPLLVYLWEAISAPLLLVNSLLKTLRIEPAVKSGFARSDQSLAPQMSGQGHPSVGGLNGLATLLHKMGLTGGFADRVIVLGADSYGGGLDFKVFVGLINQPEIRAQLFRQGVSIPENTWFLSGEYDKIDGGLLWHDANGLP